ELDRAVARVRARFAAKQPAVQALLEGRSGLEQTFLLFRKLNAPKVVAGGRPSEEAVCRDGVLHAEDLLRGRPGGGAAAALPPSRRWLEEHLTRGQGAGR